MQLQMKIPKERRSSLWFIDILWVISGIAAGATSNMKTMRKSWNTRTMNMEEKRDRLYRVNCSQSSFWLLGFS